MHIRVTDHGLAMLRTGEAVFDGLRAWEPSQAPTPSAPGSRRRLVGDSPIRADSPQWNARHLRTTTRALRTEAPHATPRPALGVPPVAVIGFEIVDDIGSFHTIPLVDEPRHKAAQVNR